jgi:hypothetical protein
MRAGASIKMTPALFGLVWWAFRFVCRSQFRDGYRRPGTVAQGRLQAPRYGCTGTVAQGRLQAPRDGCTGTVTGAQGRLPRPPCRHAGVTGITARCRHLGLRDRAISKGRGGILWSGRVLLTRFHHMFVHLSGRGRV